MATRTSFLLVVPNIVSTWSQRYVFETSKSLLVSRRNSPSRSSRSALNLFIEFTTTHTVLIARLCWYVGERYLRDLKAKEELSRRVLESLDALATFLVAECRVMDRSSDNNLRKDTRDQVPSEKVKDPAALARELRWRVRLAAGGDSGDELSPIRYEAGSINGGVGHKRKREYDHSGSREGSAPVKFKHWTPKPWDVVEMQPLRTESTVIQKRKPGEEELAQWADEEVKGEEDGSTETVSLFSQLSAGDSYSKWNRTDCVYCRSISRLERPS